ncbi:MAG: hypothetical protein ACPGJE_10535, partial [Wenzhouxiangellaceae bacterium]
LEERFESLEAVEIATGEVRTFDHAECAFGYRESVFKRALKGQFVITHVTFRLPLVPDLRLGYGAIQQELETAGVQEPDPRSVSEAVIRIRRSKLPDPAVIGNAGSFFKNPVLPNRQAAQLTERYDEMPNWPDRPGHTKLSAAWMIDQLGWRGKSVGDAAVFDRHALVLINRGRARGDDVLTLAREIRDSVLQRFGVRLQPEPVLIGGGLDAD